MHNASPQQSIAGAGAHHHNSTCDTPTSDPLSRALATLTHTLPRARVLSLSLGIRYAKRHQGMLTLVRLRFAARQHPQGQDEIPQPRPPVATVTTSHDKRRQRAHAPTIRAHDRGHACARVYSHGTLPRVASCRLLPP